MKDFTFYTKESTRIDVKASNPKSAWNKLKSIPMFNNRLTGCYGIYDKEGLMSTGQINGKIKE